MPGDATSTSRTVTGAWPSWRLCPPPGPWPRARAHW